MMTTSPNQTAPSSPPRPVVVIRQDFEGGPLASEDEYLMDEAFAESVIKLDPAWSTMRSTILDILRVFDEHGDLRPRLRLVFPSLFARCDHHGRRNESSTSATNAEREEMGRLADAARQGRRDFHDPAALHPIQADPDLRPYLSEGRTS